MESFYLDRPLNYAHRGACHDAPENTLAAFAAAADKGADGIELDVQLSKDGHIVVIHDFNLETTTDGRGLVRNRTLAELKELDAGAWFASAFAGQRIPTLQEVFDTVGGRLLLNIELKTPSWRGDRLAAAVVQAVEKNNLQERVLISSFNPLALRQVRKHNARIAIGLLYASDLPFRLRRPWLHGLIRPDALHPHRSLVDDSFMRWAKGQGYRVHTWTVDEPSEMRRLAQRKVDLIITNRPGRLRRVLSPSQEGDHSQLEDN